MRKTKAAGFFVRFFYVCTDSPDVNVRRITHRYMEGGHEVPISKIISRYYKSLRNAKQIILEVDRAYIYDNSIDNAAPRLLFRTVDGEIAKRYTDNVPQWARDII